MCVKDEKSGIYPDVDAVECRKTPNLPLLSLVGRILYAMWTIYPLVLKNAVRWLKNGFLCFLT